jgi:hypothetical protein
MVSPGAGQGEAAACRSRPGGQAAAGAQFFCRLPQGLFRHDLDKICL